MCGFFEFMFRPGLVALILSVSGCSLHQANAPDVPPAQGPSSQTRVWNFDTAALGKLPDAWEAAETKGAGKPGTWKIVADDKAPSGKQILQLETKNSRRVFNMCVLKGTTYTDVDLSVKLRADSGEIDQGGGLIWRYQDHNNYYVVRFNPLEGNYRLYKVVGGKSSQIASADVETSEGTWNTLRVTHVGDRIDCYLNGKRHLSKKDGAFSKAGKIGLWTKADASTSFDDLTLKTGGSN